MKQKQNRKESRLSRRNRFPSGRLTRFLIVLCIALMAALAVFSGIYAILGVPADALPLAPGMHYVADDGGSVFVRCGALVTKVSADALTPGQLKQPMLLFVLTAETVLLTVTALLICFVRIMDSIRVCSSCTQYAARQTSLAGLALAAGGVLTSLADGFARYRIAKVFFSGSFAQVGTKPVFHASFPLGAVLGGVLLLLLGALLYRAAAVFPHTEETAVTKTEDARES